MAIMLLSVLIRRDIAELDKIYCLYFYVQCILAAADGRGQMSIRRCKNGKEQRIL